MKRWLCLLLTVCLLLSGVALAEQPAETTVTAQQALALDASMAVRIGESAPAEHDDAVKLGVEYDNVLTFGMVDENSVFLTLDGNALNIGPSITLYGHKDRGLFLRDGNTGMWTEITFNGQKLTLDNLQGLVTSVEAEANRLMNTPVANDIELVSEALANVVEDFCDSPEVLMALARLGVGASSRRGRSISIDTATVNAVLGRLGATARAAANAIVAPELVNQLGSETRDVINAISKPLWMAAMNLKKQVEELELPNFSVDLFIGQQSVRLLALCDDFRLDITASPAGENIALDGKLSLSGSPNITISGTVGESGELLISSASERSLQSWEARLLTSYRMGMANEAWYHLLQASLDYCHQRGDMLDASQKINLSYLMQYGSESTNHVLTIDSMGEDAVDSLYADFQSASNKWSGSLAAYSKWSGALATNSNVWAFNEIGYSLELLDEGLRFTLTRTPSEGVVEKNTAELFVAQDIQVPVPGEVTNAFDLQQLLTLLK